MIPLTPPFTLEPNGTIIDAIGVPILTVAALGGDQEQREFVGGLLVSLLTKNNEIMQALREEFMIAIAVIEGCLIALKQNPATAAVEANGVKVPMSVKLEQWKCMLAMIIDEVSIERKSTEGGA